MDQPQLVDDRYQIVRLLGEGGMGAVYEARHTGTGRRVAVKVIIGDHVKNEAVVARFQREARAAGSIETQHIVQVLDTGVDRATANPYMVMEYLQGEDIQQCLKRVGPLEPNIALRVIAQACVGLEKAHAAGVIHRDIKPANLYLAAQDHGAVLVKVLDFGIAKVKVDQVTSVENAALTRTGSMLGSPLYMSPEQAKGAKSTDLRTDIWSLGVVFYEILAGITPYSHCESLGELILEICSVPPKLIQEPAPWVAPEIAAIVHRALTMDVSRRYASISDMAADVRRLLPEGAALEQGMLVPLANERRSSVAPKLSATATGLSASSANAGFTSSAQSASGTTAPGADQATAGIGSGLASSQTGAARSSKAVPLVLSGVVAASLAAFGVLHFVSGSQPVPALGPDVLARSAQPVAAALLPQPSGVTGSPVAETRSVQLAVSPATASVEVDGAPAVMSSGAITLSGAAGSVHKVRVFVGKSETTSDVVISDAGPRPSKVELSAKQLAAAAAPGGAVTKAGAAAPAGAASAPSANATRPTKPAAAATPANPGNPGVDRSFQ